MRDACPTFCGRIFASFSRASKRKPSFRESAPVGGECTPHTSARFRPVQTLRAANRGGSGQTAQVHRNPTADGESVQPILHPTSAEMFHVKQATLAVTSPISRPYGVNRKSALSCRSKRRYSEREVIMRYGSEQPFVTKSSISVPI